MTLDAWIKSLKKFDLSLDVLVRVAGAEDSPNEGLVFVCEKPTFSVDAGCTETDMLIIDMTESDEGVDEVLSLGAPDHSDLATPDFRKLLGDLVAKLPEHSLSCEQNEICFPWCWNDELTAARAALNPYYGMKMSDIKVGMRLRSTLPQDSGTVKEFVTVTAITSRGFNYSMDADFPLGPRYGVQLKYGNEHFGFNGIAFYTLAALKETEDAERK